MTIRFLGGEAGSLIPSDASARETTTSLGGVGDSYDSAFTRCYAGVAGSASYWSTPEWAAGDDDVWAHMEVDQFSASSTSTMSKLIALLDSSGVEMVRLMTNYESSGATGSWRIDYWNGASYTSSSSFTAPPSTKQVVDIHTVCNTASGSINVYLSGTNRLNTGTIDLSSIVDIAQVRYFGKTVGINSTQAYSQLAVTADGQSTIGGRLMTMYPSAAGATAQWTGAYTAVDEMAYTDADFMFSATADQVQLFAGTLVGSLTGYTVAAVAVGARANTDGTGPTQIQLALRTASTNYFSASQTLDAGYGAHVGIWETNPNTTLAWTAADAAAIQFGMKSIA